MIASDDIVPAPGPVTGPIGVFDSGFGGLTILSRIRSQLPGYDYIYLGDNARAPYGVRSFDCVYRYTLQAVRFLFDQGCPLVILACNTASAKALRSIQQHDLPLIDPSRRVLGVIRPTAEAVGSLSPGHNVGLLATAGTVVSRSYDMELAKLWPDLTLTSQACPMWVPLIENDEIDTPATDYFIDKYLRLLLSAAPEIDTIILGCTHYPLLAHRIEPRLPQGVRLVCQGDIVARSLADYLGRHPEMDRRLTRGGMTTYYTTENADRFDSMAHLFIDGDVRSAHIDLS